MKKKLVEYNQPLKRNRKVGFEKSLEIAFGKIVTKLLGNRQRK